MGAENTLRMGLRDLPDGSSLRQFLARERSIGRAALGHKGHGGAASDEGHRVDWAFQKALKIW
jgi:hypothetical protein